MMDFESAGQSGFKAWKDIWGAGQGVGAIHKVEPVAARTERFIEEYRMASAALSENVRPFS